MALSRVFTDAVGPDGADVIDADLIYDAVGGEYAEPALRSIGSGGRYLVVGFSAGIPRLPLNLTLLKSCDVRGVFWGVFVARYPQAQRHASQLLDCGAQAWRGLHRPNFTLSGGEVGIARVASRSSVGKDVVLVGE